MPIKMSKSAVTRYRKQVKDNTAAITALNETSEGFFLHTLKDNPNIVNFPFVVLSDTKDGVVIESVDDLTDKEIKLWESFVSKGEEVSFAYAEKSNIFQDAFKEGAKSLKEAKEITLATISKAREKGGYIDQYHEKLDAGKKLRGEK